MPCTRFFARALALILTASDRAAGACTVCDSRAGHQLRAGLFNGHLLHTLLLVAAPVPVFVAAVALVYLGMPDLAELPPEPSAAMRAPELAA